MTVRVLHLEDSQADADLVEGTLAGAGMACEIVCVDSRQAFSNALEDARFDVVLSDNKLPSFDGLSALRMVRTRDLFLPFIFVSGTMGEEAAVRSLTSGATDYVLKGNLTRLPAAISRAIDAADERRRRQAAEIGLRESEARYRALVETSWDWVWAIDATGAFTFSSQAGERTTGHAPDKLIGRSWTAFVPADDAAVAERAFRRCAVERAPVQSFAVQWRHADGRVRHLEVSATPIWDDSEALAGFHGSTRDVTDRLQLERELRHAQKMEALGTLAGGIAHDFNNLLTAVSGASELLLEALGPDNRLRREVESIRRAAAHGESLTRQLLAFSRRQVIAPTLVDIGELTQGLEQILRRLIGARASVVVQIEPSLPLVLCDRGQLEQVLINLAVNARDAMPSGGTLTIDVYATVVDESQVARHPDAAAGPHVVLVVRDTGVGIDADTLAHIFEPFFTTKEPGHGTGLGLSTVYGIARQVGGHVRVESTPGRGTAFLVYLPAPNVDRVP